MSSPRNHTIEGPVLWFLWLKGAPAQSTGSSQRRSLRTREQRHHEAPSLCPRSAPLHPPELRPDLSPFPTRPSSSWPDLHCVRSDHYWPDSNGSRRKQVALPEHKPKLTDPKPTVFPPCHKMPHPPKTREAMTLGLSC